MHVQVDSKIAKFNITKPKVPKIRTRKILIVVALSYMRFCNLHRLGVAEQTLSGFLPSDCCGR